MERSLRHLDTLICPSHSTMHEHARRGIKARMTHLPYFLPHDYTGLPAAASPGYPRPYVAAATESRRKARSARSGAGSPWDPGVPAGLLSQSPMISSRPSSMWASSSGEIRPRRAPRRSVEIVRIWPILTQDGFGSRTERILKLKGNPAVGSWLVMARAITVSERSLKMSWLRIRTGLRPPAHGHGLGQGLPRRCRPLSMRATRPSGTFWATDGRAGASRA